MIWKNTSPTALAPQDAAAPPAPRQLALPDFLTAPAPARQTQSSPGPRDKTEIQAKCQRTKAAYKRNIKRHKSGIKAVQTRPPVKNILQDQIDILNDKRSAQKVAKVCKRDLPPAVLALLEEFPTPPPAVMALLAESPTPAPKTARRQPKTVSAPPPPANAASVGRESEAPPAFRESDAPAAIPATDAPSATAPLTAASLISSPQPPTANRKPSLPAPPANAASEPGGKTKCIPPFGKRSASRRFGHRPAPGTPGRAPGNPGRNPGRRTGRLPGGLSPVRPPDS